MIVYRVTGQLVDTPTRGQSSRRLVNSRTSQLAEMFDLKFGVYNSSKCNLGQITLFIRCQYLIGLQLWLGLGLMYNYNLKLMYSNSMIFKIRWRRVD